MLTMTPNAAEAVRALAAGDAVEPSRGIRISAGTATMNGAPLEVALVDGPEAADQTIDDSGARLFVSPEVAPFLDDKVLDAEVDAGQVRFAISDSD